MKFTELAWKIFNESINDYHKIDDVNTKINNPYNEESIEAVLYKKNWIDTVQWHLEDIIRDPNINPEKALEIKRWIDNSNQERTDVVELFDDYFQNQFKEVNVKENAKINTESPAWAIDRLSILSLKIYHMKEETTRENASESHIKKCKEKLFILETQHNDLSTAIEELLEDLEQGNKYMKSYKQMKMYNDEELNPVLYKK
ncbi:MAG: DUF4254 domain-containing protein [Flavobacteriales bacterium]|nr:DUF4254 domain-containing protein [Flavobacteriales bacterium]